MVHTYVKLPIHGGFRHYTYLAMASYICWERGFEFVDPISFQFKYQTPGIPDIYIKYKRKKKDEYGTRTFDQYACIEIETHATSESVRKKTEQFENQAQNVEMHVVPMNKYEKWKSRQIENGHIRPDEFQYVYDFIALYLPEKETKG